MEPDAISGGIGAIIAWAVAWMIAKVGAWSKRQKWTHTFVTESVEKIAKERDKARAELAVARVDLAAAKAVAEACQGHMTRQLKEGHPPKPEKE